MNFNQETIDSLSALTKNNPGFCYSLAYEADDEGKHDKAQLLVDYGRYLESLQSEASEDLELFEHDGV